MIQEYDVLTGAQCADVDRRVRALQALWIPRGNSSRRFFTLGAAGYCEEVATYYERIKVYNPILERHFGALLAAIRRVLYEQHLNAGKCVFSSVLALPGFHIFPSNAIHRSATASLHFDLQFDRIGLARIASVEHTECLSFTLPITLPKGGGGLDYWNVSFHDMNKNARIGHSCSLEAECGSKEKLTVKYVPGKLVVHSGLLAHRIAGSPDVQPQDYRITLQGHALLWRHQHWVIYW